MEQQFYDSTKLIIDSIEKQSLAEIKRLMANSARLDEQKSAELAAEIQEKYQAYAAYELEKRRAEASRHFSQLENANKARLAKERQKIVKLVFEETYTRLKAFTETEAYPVFLENSLKKLSALYEGKATVLLKKSDLQYQERLQEVFGRPVSFSEDRTIILGGLSVRFEEKAVLVCDTLDVRLEEQKGAFLKSSGLGEER